MRGCAEASEPCRQDRTVVPPRAARCRVGACASRPPPSHVSSETVSPDLRLRSPYRGIVTGRSILRLRVVIAPRGIAPHEVVVEVDDLAIEVHEDAAGPSDGVLVCAGAVDAL